MPSLAPGDLEKPKRRLGFALAGVGAIVLGVVAAVILLRFGGQPEASTEEPNREVASNHPVKAAVPIGSGSLVLPMGGGEPDPPTPEPPVESPDAGAAADETPSKSPRRNGSSSPSRREEARNDSPPAKAKTLTEEQRRMLEQAKSLGQDTVAPLSRPDRGSSRGSAKRSQPLSGDEIRATVSKNRTSIQRCYEREMRGASGSDLRVELRITVQPSGVVSNVRVSPANIRGTRLGSCMQGAARRWRFPSATAPSTFDVPFVLTPGRRH